MFNTYKSVLEENPPIPPKVVKDAPLPAEGEEKEGELHDKPFKPANPGKRGVIGTINKFPEH